MTAISLSLATSEARDAASHQAPIAFLTEDAVTPGDIYKPLDHAGIVLPLGAECSGIVGM